MPAAETNCAGALTRDDLFVVTIDCFPTDTTSYSDVVLPAASFLEFDDLVWNYFHPYLGTQVGVMEPPGESLPTRRSSDASQRPWG